MIIILAILVVGTSIHDPICRHLIDEENEDEKRIWCTMTYPQSVQIFDSIIHPLHVHGPFIINLISTTIFITKKSRQKANLQPDRPYNEQIREQCRQYKHLFVVPVLLVILSAPRLIQGGKS